MALVTLSSSGSFKNTIRFLKKIQKLNITSILEKYGNEGVRRLKEYTPRRTGKTAESWTYNVQVSKDSASVNWWNTNINDGVPIALIIQYGHGTRNGGYVAGIDYINPALKPVFEKMADEVWKEIENV